MQSTVASTQLWSRLYPEKVNLVHFELLLAIYQNLVNGKAMSTAMIHEAEELVKRHMAQYVSCLDEEDEEADVNRYDPSHDWAHGA
jgi:hypothetical protein